MTQLKSGKALSKLDGLILRSVDRHGTVGNRLNHGSINVILRRLKASLVHEVPCYNFSGHSFRVGAAIDLLRAGASLETIMLKGGWRSQDQAMNHLRCYLVTLGNGGTLSSDK